MPQWSGQVGKCSASKIPGDDVGSATRLAPSLCSSVGANQFLIPASVTRALSEAAAEKLQMDASTTDSAVSSTDAREYSTQLRADSTSENLAIIKVNHDICSMVVVLLATLLL